KIEFEMHWVFTTISLTHKKKSTIDPSSIFKIAIYFIR
ncbi:MAG: hypothetical protein ACI8RD_004693, partial [Bacillariaceae sp.]